MGDPHMPEAVELHDGDDHELRVGIPTGTCSIIGIDIEWKDDWAWFSATPAQARQAAAALSTMADAAEAAQKENPR